jgi:uncharacterized protein
VGLSANPQRPSHGVAKFLQAQGFKVIPVNPAEPEILGQKSYLDLKAIPEKVHVVNIFRKSEAVPEIVDQAIEIKAALIWMQLEVEHEEAATLARSHGIEVVMNRCLAVALRLGL